MKTVMDYWKLRITFAAIMVVFFIITKKPQWLSAVNGVRLNHSAGMLAFIFGQSLEFVAQARFCTT